MYRLFYAPGAASLVVHWLLIEMELPHQLQLVNLETGEQKSAEYLALNPNGVVPTLVSDGSAYFEAAALVLQLADAHSKAKQILPRLPEVSLGRFTTNGS